MATATGRGTPAAQLLIVDDEPMVRELLCSYLSGNGYACDTAASVDEAWARLDRGGIDLVISDLHMPGGTGMELLARVAERYPEVGFLMATAAPETRTAVQAMRTGASDFLMKPLDLKDVLATVGETVQRQRQRAAVAARRQELERLLTERTQQLGSALLQVQQASADTLQALAMALDVRARDVAGHSLRVSRYGVELARRMGYSDQDLARIEYASYLHDIGKLGIPDAILNKPAKLNEQELEVMRSHVQIGFDLVTQVQSLASAADLVLTHQEHFDGRGYPRGLAGEQIPLDARIFAVADAFDAMTSDRPYRRALSYEHARREIASQSGRQFDPAVAEAFLAIPAERWRDLRAETDMPTAAAGPPRI
ncbi:MAG: HD domain-containing phosphohydrolase [Terriglobales bacterium]